MTLIDRARHLLTCDELRGQLPDEVAEFLREVVALEPVAHMHGDALVKPMTKDRAFNWGRKVEFSIPLYTLETPYDAG